jgi:hypothetical protein
MRGIADCQDLIYAEGDTDELRSRLATLLLKRHGEVMLSLGAHPTAATLFNPDPDKAAQHIGKALTAAELDKAVQRLQGVCDELKAELNELYRAEGVYGCWLVRLTPRGVEEIMEVRVAVVGNVDAGKSTTLGVLTRGGLDDGRGKVSRTQKYALCSADIRLGLPFSVTRMRLRLDGRAR